MKTPPRKAIWFTAKVTPKVRKPIRKVTPSMAKLRAIYRKRVREVMTEWLADDILKWCPVAWLVAGKLILISQTHHVHGRRQRLLLYEPWWLFVSDYGHQWIESHPDEARRRGWLCEKGQWNTQPPKDV